MNNNRMVILSTNKITDKTFDKMLQKKSVLHYIPHGIQNTEKELIREEPLAINIQGKTHAVIMRTPGEEKAHAAGFCLSEGIIDSLDDIADIALCEPDISNVATIMLTEKRAKKISSLLEKNVYLSQAGYGICGREIIEDLNKILLPLNSTFIISFTQAMEVVNCMKDIQKLRKRCFSSHATAIFNDKLEKISQAEDVGRHNTLDKAVGKLFLKKKLSYAAIALLSSRASYEMIQKCARAGIEMVISMSRPTALAVKLGKKMNMTIASVRDNGLYVFTGPDRIVS